MDELPGIIIHPKPTLPATDTPLRRFLADLVEGDGGEALLRTLRRYVRTAGLATDATVREIALELFNETVVESLDHEDRFDATRSPKAWLLGIALNLVKRRKDELIKKQHREPLARDIYPNAQALSDDELFDLIASLADVSPEQRVLVAEQVNGMLALVSPDDRQIIELAVLHGLNGEDQARALGIKPGAARARLHRALHRLGEAWTRYCTGPREGDNHE